MNGPLNQPEVVFRDQVLIVINKPPGMPTQSTRQGKEGTLEAWLEVQEGVHYTAFHHRLDAAAQGLVCAALDRRANVSLARSFRERLARRTYRAIVHGEPQGAGGTWHHLGRRRGSRRSVVPFEAGAAGEEMLAEWALKEVRSPYSLIEVQLQTGRTHQIRLQASTEGHPILGDRTYGFSEPGGLRLQACALQIGHPLTGERLSWTVDLPASWADSKFGQ